MRNNHEKENHKLVKRAFALCLALAVICSCLLPVFATETAGVATMQEQGGVAVQMDDNFGVDPSKPGSGSTGSDDSTPVNDPSSVEGVTFPEGATNIVKNPNGSYSYDTKDGHYTVYPDAGKVDMGDGTVKPNPNLAQDDAAFGVLPIEYHFWLKQMDNFDLSDLAWEAEMSERSEAEYLALFGASDKFPIWHMDTISSTDTISNYRFDDPTSLNDPEKKGREFAGWYTVDSTGLKHEFDFYQSYGSESDTIVNVYADWKEASGDVVDDTKKDDETKEEDTKKDEETKKDKATFSEEAKQKYQKMFIELVTCDSVEKQMKLFDECLAGDDAENFLAYIETMDEKSQDAFENLCLSISLARGDVATYAIDTGAHGNTISLGETIKMECTSTNHSNYTWYTSSNDIILVTNADGSATITVKDNATPGNTVTVYHQGTGWGGWTDKSEYRQLKIVKKFDNVTNAEIFYLASPDSNPKSNDINLWLPSGGTSTWTGTVNTSGALWEDGLIENTDRFGNITVTKYTNKNIYLTSLTESEITKYIISWPGGTTGATWTLVRDDSKTGRYFTTVLNSIWNDTNPTEYQKKLAQDLGVPVSQLKKTDIQEITLIPYKISQNKTLHIDCNISIKSKRSYTAIFRVKQPGTSYYDQVYAKNYPLNTDGTADGPIAKVTQNDIANYKDNNTYNHEIDDTKVVDGITYKFVGWRKETNAANVPGELILESDWPYTPTQSELADNVVYFYAEYVPVSANLTITKTVTGLLGDKKAGFEFTIKNADGTAVAITSSSARVECAHETRHGNFSATNGTFTLGDGDSITFENLPIGDYIIEEKDYSGQSYTTTYKFGDVDGKDNSVTVEHKSDNQIVAFTNDRDVKVDSGVLLDTLPYIVILAVVVGGGVLLMMHKRRKEDDE